MNVQVKVPPGKRSRDFTCIGRIKPMKNCPKKKLYFLQVVEGNILIVKLIIWLINIMASPAHSVSKIILVRAHYTCYYRNFFFVRHNDGFMCFILYGRVIIRFKESWQLFAPDVIQASDNTSRVLLNYYSEINV